MSLKNMIGWSAILITGIGLAGCGTSQDKPAPATTTPSNPVGKTPGHEGWWCNEHGVPEGICGQCSTKLAADFKTKGDWCKQHDRPESQCFICHPELEAKFAAQYEAKYGKKPPKRQEEEHGKGEADHEHKEEKKS